MSALTLLAGGGLVLLGWLLGRVSRRAPSVEKPKPPNLTCGCGHELSMHDLKSGACNDEVWQPFYDRTLDMQMRRLNPCRCKQYTGDRPVDTFFSPRMV